MSAGAAKDRHRTKEPIVKIMAAAVGKAKGPPDRKSAAAAR